MINLRTKYLIKNIKNKKLVHKFDISEYIKKTYLDGKIKKLVTKAAIKAEKGKVMRPQHLIYFPGKSNFEDDVVQNYLMFQPVQEYFKKIDNSKCISAQNSKVVSHESIKPHTICNDSSSPALNYISAKIRIKFDGSYLKQDKLTYTHKTVVNIHIVYEVHL